MPRSGQEKTDSPEGDERRWTRTRRRIQGLGGDGALSSRGSHRWLVGRQAAMNGRGGQGGSWRRRWWRPVESTRDRELTRSGVCARRLRRGPRSRFPQSEPTPSRTPMMGRGRSIYGGPRSCSFTASPLIRLSVILPLPHHVEQDLLSRNVPAGRLSLLVSQSCPARSVALSSSHPAATFLSLSAADRHY